MDRLTVGPPDPMAELKTAREKWRLWRSEESGDGSSKIVLGSTFFATLREALLTVFHEAKAYRVVNRGGATVHEGMKLTAEKAKEILAAEEELHGEAWSPVVLKAEFDPRTYPKRVAQGRFWHRDVECRQLRPGSDEPIDLAPTMKACKGELWPCKSCIP